MLFRSRLDRVKEVVCGVIHAWEDVGEALCVGRPEDNELFELVVRLELADVGAELLEVGLFVIAGKEVICTLLLIGGDKVGVVDRGERLDRSHQGDKLALKVPGEDLGTLHSRIKRSTRDVPPADDEVIGVHGGEDGGEGDMDILARRGVDTKAKGRSTEDGANVVGRPSAFLRAPGDIVGVS